MGLICWHGPQRTELKFSTTDDGIAPEDGIESASSWKGMTDARRRAVRRQIEIRTMSRASMPDAGNAGL
jgi:hypothetical protein